MCDVCVVCVMCVCVCLMCVCDVCVWHEVRVCVRECMCAYVYGVGKEWSRDSNINWTDIRQSGNGVGKEWSRDSNINWTDIRQSGNKSS